MPSALLLLTHTLIAVIAVAMGALVLHPRFDLIALVMSISGVAVTSADIVQIGYAFALIQFILGLGLTLTYARKSASAAAQAASRIYAWIATWGVATTLLFLGTSVPFAPNLYVWVFISGFVLVAAVALLQVIRADGVHSALRATTAAALANVVRPFGALSICIALLPGALALAYRTDHDLANLINMTRRYVSGDSNSRWALEPVTAAKRFAQPIDIAFSPGDPGAAYVLERHGRVLRIDWPSGDNQTVLLDFSASVGLTEFENGALGLALHPNFARGSANGLVYINYTRVVAPKRHFNTLSSFDLSAESPAARLATRIDLVDQARRVPDGFHNGGTVKFGPDGYLYFSVGEVSDGERHQSIDAALYGGIFRIDVDRKGADLSHPIRRQPASGKTQNYYIPSDNPFVGKPGALEEFYALGLRNPFRFSFDSKTGQIWAGDVGGVHYEEVNVIKAGSNHQYPFAEGPLQRPSKVPSEVVGEQRTPYFSYRHTALDRAIIGGFVYRGTALPGLTGHYVFGDNYSGRIMALALNTPDQANARHIAQTDQLGQLGICTITQSAGGDLLVLTLGRKDAPTGGIYRIVALGADEQAPRVSGPTISGTTADMLERYRAECARCHGLDGRGGENAKAELGIELPDLSDPRWQAARTDSDIYNAIADGGAAVGLSPLMPPWKALYSKKDIQALVQIVRDLRRPEKE